MTDQLWYWVQSFLVTENGLKLAWVLLVLGAVDFLFGMSWLFGSAQRSLGNNPAHNSDTKRTPGVWRSAAETDGTPAFEKPKMRRWLPLFLLLDGVLMALGSYGLYLHRILG